MSDQPNARAIRIKRQARWLNRNWIYLVLVFFFIFNIGAWVAPVLMRIGAPGAGKYAYWAYAPFCHQMAQRSFFLFGEKTMYPPEEMPVELTGYTGTDTLLLRKFRGTEELGWKVAWSDRMVSMYGGLWLAMFIFMLRSRRREVYPLSPWLFAFSIVPMAVDGTTHFISDLDGLFEGFRYTNAWLANLTGDALSASFYRGDALGSFNFWMRLISGLSFGFGVVGFAFPYLWRNTQESADILDEQLAPYIDHTEQESDS